MCQVGAIILYTYVFHLLAPPREGFYGEGEHIPIKNSPQNSHNGSATPEEVPLLSQDPGPGGASVSSKGTVSITVHC